MCGKLTLISWRNSRDLTHPDPKGTLEGVLKLVEVQIVEAYEATCSVWICTSTDCQPLEEEG